MTECCIAVVSEARARLFKVETIEFPALESGPRLIECGELLNKDREVPERDLYTDSKTGRGRAPRGGPAHGYEDHRSQHADENERRFARKVLKRVSWLAQKNQTRRVVVAAPARMLGFLRQDMDILLRDGIEVDELAKDMIKFNPQRIHTLLAQKQLIPMQKRPGT